MTETWIQFFFFSVSSYALQQFNFSAQQCFQCFSSSGSIRDRKCCCCYSKVMRTAITRIRMNPGEQKCEGGDGERHAQCCKELQWTQLDTGSAPEVPEFAALIGVRHHLQEDTSILLNQRGLRAVSSMSSSLIICSIIFILQLVSNIGYANPDVGCFCWQSKWLL